MVVPLKLLQYAVSQIQCAVDTLSISARSPIMSIRQPYEGRDK